MKKAILLLVIMTFFTSPFITPARAETSPNKDNMIYLYGGSAQTYKKQLAITKNLVGTLIPGYFDIDSSGNLIDRVDPSFVRHAHDNGYKITPFISNHWDYELGAKAMANRVKLAEQLAHAALKHNLDGVNIDIENLTEKERKAQTEFLQLLVKKLRPHGKTVAIAVAPVPYDTDKGWFGSYDFEEIGKTADTVFIMAYEQHYLSGAAGPQAGVDWTKSSIRYLSSKIPKQKLVLGVPFYGRYWTWNVKGNAFTFAQAERLMKRNGVSFKWNKAHQSTFALFIDKNTGTQYEIWIDNAESLKKKISLVEQFGLRGWGGWRLGQEDPQIWSMLAEQKQEAQPREGRGQQIAAEAKKLVGKRITNNSSFDFISSVYKQKGVNVPSTLAGLKQVGSLIKDPQKLQPGDIVFFGSSAKNIFAAGIYSGNGKFLLAHKPYQTIKELKLSSSVARKYYLGAKRVVQ